MKNTFLLALVLCSTLTHAQNLSCSKQKSLAQLPEKALFGFELETLPMGDNLERDESRKVVKGSCFFQVFYMYTYDRYFPYLVGLDVGSDSVFEERLLGDDRRDRVRSVMEAFRQSLRNCDCSI